MRNVPATYTLFQDSEPKAKVRFILEERGDKLTNKQEYWLEADYTRPVFKWTHYEIDMEDPLVGHKRTQLSVSMKVHPEDRLLFRVGSITINVRRN